MLKAWDPELYSGIVYDEANLTHLHREAQLHHCTLDADMEIYARYHNPLLTAGRRVIFTCNPHPRQILLFDDEAIRRRLQVVHVKGRNLYEPWDLDTGGPLAICPPAQSGTNATSRTTGGSTSIQYTLVS